MAPSVDYFINDQRGKSLWPLRNDDPRASFIQFVIKPIAIEGLVGEQIIEFNTVDEWWHTDSVIAVALQENEADQIAQRISQREDFGRPATF